VPRPRTLLVAALVAVLLLGGWVGYLVLRPSDRYQIAPSYAFDVSDRRQVAGFADQVFVGTVADKAGVDRSNGPPTTNWTVEVEQVLKGTVAGSVRVRQTGTSRSVGDGVTPLSVGGTFLIAATDSDGRLISVGGPSAPARIESAADRSRLVAQWEKAIAEQRWPNNLPR
jgi:hypothetical protein